MDMDNSVGIGYRNGGQTGWRGERRKIGQL